MALASIENSTLLAYIKGFFGVSQEIRIMPKLTKNQKNKTEIPGESAPAPNSSVFQPKARQLHIFSKPIKSQISTIPGTSPKERNRYRVVLGDEVLGDSLTLDEALELAKGGQHG